MTAFDSLQTGSDAKNFMVANVRRLSPEWLIAKPNFALQSSVSYNSAHHWGTI